MSIMVEGKRETLEQYVRRNNEGKCPLVSDMGKNEPWIDAYYDEDSAASGFVSKRAPLSATESRIIKAYKQHNANIDPYPNRVRGNENGHYNPRNEDVVRTSLKRFHGVVRKIPDHPADPTNIPVGMYVDWARDEMALNDTEMVKQKKDGDKGWYVDIKMVMEPHKGNPNNPDPWFFEHEGDTDPRVYRQAWANKNEEAYDIGMALIDSRMDGMRREGSVNDMLAEEYGVNKSTIRENAIFANACDIIGEEKGISGREVARTLTKPRSRLVGDAKVIAHEKYDWVLVNKPANPWMPPWEMFEGVRGYQAKSADLREIPSPYRV